MWSEERPHRAPYLARALGSSYLFPWVFYFVLSPRSSFARSGAEPRASRGRERDAASPRGAGTAGFVNVWARGAGR